MVFRTKLTIVTVSFRAVGVTIFLGKNNPKIMANTTISMNKIRQILRLHDHGRSKQAIAIQAGASRKTFQPYNFRVLQGISFVRLLELSNLQKG